MPMLSFFSIIFVNPALKSEFYSILYCCAVLTCCNQLVSMPTSKFDADSFGIMAILSNLNFNGYFWQDAD